jgi:hypothetical protein
LLIFESYINFDITFFSLVRQNWPYVERYEDPKTGVFKYNGFMIDLLQKISEYWKNEYEFEFYYAPDGHYGSISDGGRINGMIGEVYNGVSNQGF